MLPIVPIVSNQLSLFSTSPVSALFRHQSSSFHKGLLILWKLAWRSRLRICALILTAFMILDVHMTLEVRVDVGGDGVIDVSDDEGEDSEDDGDANEDAGEDLVFFEY